MFEKLLVSQMDPCISVAWFESFKRVRESLVLKFSFWQIKHKLWHIVTTSNICQLKTKHFIFEKNACAMTNLV